MDCQNLEIYLSALLDGELEARKKLLVQNHLKSCQACHQEYHLLKSTKNLIKQNIPQEKAPAYLRNKILKKIEEEKAKKTRQWLASWLLQPRALIPALGVLIMVSSFIVYTIFLRPPSARLVSALVAAHDNYVNAEMPITLITSNPQQLSTWFRTKVDFSFEVPRLEQVNLNLIGGDVLDLAGLEGAHILYHSPTGHKTSLFIFKDQEKRLSYKKIQENGYEFYVGNDRNCAVLFWKEGRLLYSLVCAGASHIQDLAHCALWVRKE